MLLAELSKETSLCKHPLLVSIFVISEPGSHLVQILNKSKDLRRNKIPAMELGC